MSSRFGHLRLGYVCGALAMATVAAPASDDMVWQSFQFDGADGGASRGISVGVPETDHIMLSGSCTASIGSAVPRITFGAPVDGLRDGDRMEIQFLNTSGDAVYSGRAAGTDAEVGVSGIEVELSVDDEIWQVMSERRTIGYRVGGEVMNLPLGGSARAIEQFLNDCNAYAANAHASTSQTMPLEPTADNPMTCEAYQGARSQNSHVPATVTFDNRTEGYRSVMWLDFDGVPQQMAALNPGESSTINTYLTHPWMITDGPGNCLEIHMPQPGTTTFRLTAPNRWFGDE